MKTAIALLVTASMLGGCATADRYVKQDGTSLTGQEAAQLRIICNSYAESGSEIDISSIPWNTTSNTNGTISPFGSSYAFNSTTTYRNSPDPYVTAGAAIANAIARDSRFNDCAIALGLKNKPKKDGK